MARGANFKNVDQAKLQPAEGGDLFDSRPDAAASPTAATDTVGLAEPDNASPAVTGGAIDDVGWNDMPEEKTGPPFDGLPAIVTRDLETGVKAVWVKTRRYDARQVMWVDDGFWVVPNTRHRIYPMGVEPIAWRREE